MHRVTDLLKRYSQVDVHTRGSGEVQQYVGGVAVTQAQHPPSHRVDRHTVEYMREVQDKSSMPSTCRQMPAINLEQTQGHQDRDSSCACPKVHSKLELQDQVDPATTTTLPTCA
jgi:hypothetical protein